MPDYDPETNPYMVLKDGSGVSLIDCKNFQACKIIDLPFLGVYCGDYTMLLKKEEEKLKIISCGYSDTTMERLLIEIHIWE